MIRVADVVLCCWQHPSATRAWVSDVNSVSFNKNDPPGEFSAVLVIYRSSSRAKRRLKGEVSGTGARYSGSIIGRQSSRLSESVDVGSRSDETRGDRPRVSAQGGAGGLMLDGHTAAPMASRARCSHRTNMSRTNKTLRLIDWTGCRHLPSISISQLSAT